MPIPPGIGRILDSFRSAGGVVADGATLAALGITAAGGAVASPVLAGAAVAIAGLAGWSLIRDWRTGKKIDRILEIEGALAAFIRARSMEKQSLEAVLISMCDDPGAVANLPPGVGREPLAALLAIIRAEGKRREELLAAQSQLCENLHVWIAREFGEIRDALALNERSLEDANAAIRSVRSDIQTIQWLWMNARSPRLRIPRLDEGHESDRFKFAARRVTMLGREAELRELGAFLEDEASFRWWAWVGAAGMGKSRLALELCLAITRAGWHAGFFDWKAAADHPPDWRSWSPERPTLIVFDYVYEHAEAIRNAIAQLARGRDALLRRVRVLLLERLAPGMTREDEADGRVTVSAPAFSWWETILDRGHGTDESLVHGAAHRRAARGEPVPRRLGGLAPAAVRAIFIELAERSGQSLSDGELADRVARLERVDPERSPLYVALAAEAIESGQLRPRWDAQDLASFVLNREIVRWEKSLLVAGITKPDLHRWLGLYRFSTVCGGLRLRSDDGTADVLKDPALEDDLPTRHDYGDGSAFATIAPGATPDRAPRLEPDMLGELFVLEWPSGPARFADAAWRHAPEGYGEFLARAADSFPTHPALDELLGVGTPAAGGERAGRGALALALAIRNDRLQDSIDSGLISATTEALLGLLRLLNRAEPEIELYRAWLASGLNNAIARSGSDTGRADRLLGELRALRDEHPDDTAVREPLAKGLFNAFNNSGADTGRADRLLGELRALRDEHPDDTAVREQLAKGLFNAFNNSGADTGRADRLLGELRALRDEHPDDTAVREPLANGLFNAIYNSGADTGRADRLLGELRALRDEHPDDTAVREPLAKAYGITMDRAVATEDADLAADCAEALVPFREVVIEPEFAGAFHRIFTDALDLAIRTNNQRAGVRITASSRAIFGGA